MGQWDRFRLEQVVTIVLTNAIKYGRGAPIAVDVRASNGHVVFSCTDRGVGIPPDMLDTIFAPYRRAVQGREYGGLGLGLHIAKTIVAAFGGAITAANEPSGGATFTVDLPVSRSHDNGQETRGARSGR